MVVALIGSALAAPQFPSSPAPPLRPFGQTAFNRPSPFRGPSTPIPPPPPIFASPSPPVFASPSPTLPPPTPAIYKPVAVNREIPPGQYFAIVRHASDVGFDGTFNYE